MVPSRIGAPEAYFKAIFFTIKDSLILFFNSITNYMILNPFWEKYILIHIQVLLV